MYGVDRNKRSRVMGVNDLKDGKCQHMLNWESGYAETMCGSEKVEGEFALISGLRAVTCGMCLLEIGEWFTRKAHIIFAGKSARLI